MLRISYNIALVLLNMMTVMPESHNPTLGLLTFLWNLVDKKRVVANAYNGCH